MRLVSMTSCTMQLCTQDAGEVTFDTYKERQMHYAGMKRPISLLYTVTLWYGVFFLLLLHDLGPPGNSKTPRNTVCLMKSAKLGNKRFLQTAGARRMPCSRLFSKLERAGGGSWVCCHLYGSS